MEKLLKAIVMMALIPMCLYAQESNDSTSTEWWENEYDLPEVVIVGTRTVLKQMPDRIVYLTRNDIYAKGLNGMEILDRIPRVSVVNDLVTVAGKSSVRYIVDGRLLEMSEDAIAQQLKNLQASGIEKIELLTTPPAKYTAGTNVAYISITTHNETLGTRGNVWGRGVFKEDFNNMMGGNISHTNKKVEMSADASWSDVKGINNLERTFTFEDHIKTSDRSNRFTNKQFGVNGLLKYKFIDRFSVGAIANASGIRLKSRLTDVTIDNGTCFSSYNSSPSRPNNALTLTAFSDWQIDEHGKTVSLTYNYFNKSAKSYADVITTGDSETVHLTDDADNKYRIHSLKLDAVLPFHAFKMEMGLAFTGIENNTALATNRYESGLGMVNVVQVNSFNYDENTAAAYISMEKDFSHSFFGKLGLRYEHTKVKGYQTMGNERHDNSYGYLFPSLHLSWNSQNIGRFSLSYSMGISRQNFADLNPFRYYTTTNDYVSGNPDLRPSIAHNAEINYGFKSVYAVLYHSYNHNAIGYVTRFNDDGSQYTQPENCVKSSKTGLYTSYNRSFFGWWDVNVGGEVFYTDAKSKITDFRNQDDKSWSGKIELNNTWMLNHKKNLIFDLRFSHYLPYHERMVHYRSMSLINCNIRYMLFDNRLTLSASVSDPFGWNVTKSFVQYSGYNIYSRNDIHSHSISFRIVYSFGRKKVNGVYRDSKEREAGRSY